MMQQPINDRKILNRLKGLVAFALVAATVVLAARPSQPVFILTVNPPVESGTSSLPSITLSGTAAPGASVGIYADDSRVATTFTPMDGKWKVSFDRPTKLPENYRVDMLDSNMATIASKTLSSEPKTEIPEAAERKKFAMIQPADGELMHPGIWLISGTGTPLYKVKIFLDDTIQLREVTVGHNRKWSANVTVRAGGRYRNLKAVIYDERGKQVDYEEVRLDIAPK